MQPVSIVGAGPGHPDFLTLKAWRVLQAAQVIFYDALLDSSLIDCFPRGALAIFCGKRCGDHAMTQEEIHRSMIRFAQKGKRVVRLKGGDPFVFGRGGEEVQALKAAGITVEVVPGVSSVNGIGGIAGIPLTHREVSRSVTIVEGHRLENLAWRELAGSSGTLVFLMGAKKLVEIAARLVEAGMEQDTPIALVETGPDFQQVLQTGQLATADRISKKTSGPGIIYVGRVVSLQLTSANTSARPGHQEVQRA